MERRIWYCFLGCIFVLERSLNIEAGTTEATTNAFANGGNTESVKAKTTQKTTAGRTTITPTTARSDIVVLDTGKHSEDYLVEFEDSLTEKQLERFMIFRSESSNNRTLHITAKDAGREFEATLCVEGSGDKKVRIQVISLVYSNDGPSDRITLELDGNILGAAKTEEFYNGGHEWNYFKDTGPIGEAVTLNNGNHTLLMRVKTDQWGAEFDTMTIRALNQNPAAELFCRSRLV